MPYTQEVQIAHDVTLRQVKTLWGKAREWQCILCFDTARDWAYLWRTHSPTDPEGFVPFCPRCHIDYDKIGQKRPRQSELMKGNQNRAGIKFRPDQDHGGAKAGNKNLLGKKFSEETKKKMSASRLAYLERKRQD